MILYADSRTITTTLRDAIISSMRDVLIAGYTDGLNLVLNPGLETGDFTSWTVPAGSGHTVSTTYKYAGSYSYRRRVPVATSTGISQVIDVVDGHEYRVCF